MAKNIDRKVCQEVVSILANAGEAAGTIIRRAIKECEHEINKGKWGSTPTDKLFWNTLAEENGWVIEQYSSFGNVRLNSPTQKGEVSIKDDLIIQAFFNDLIKIGKEEIKINNWLSNMALDKDGEFIVLLGRMGAKHINSISLDKQNNNFGFNADINANSPIGSFNIGAGTNFKDDLKRFKKYDVYFEDNVANFTDDLLNNSKWFKNDPDMNSLFTIIKERKIKRWEYKSSLSVNSSINFSIEAKKAGVAEVDLKNAFDKMKGVYREFIVEF